MYTNLYNAAEAALMSLALLINLIPLMIHHFALKSKQRYSIALIMYTIMFMNPYTNDKQQSVRRIFNLN